MTNPINEIIPREVPENIAPILNEWSNILEEFVNFGTHIMIWDTNPKTKGEENIAPTMLFRHFLDLVDTLSILVKHSCGDTSKLVIRGALEVMLGIEYLFQKDTDDRAMAFLVVEVLNQIKVLKKLNPNSKEGEEFNSVMQQENLKSTHNITAKFDLDKATEAKENIFKLPQFQKAYNDYLRLKSNKEKNPKWYRFYDGPKNIEALASHLQQKTLYELLYRKWSGAVHGSDIYLGKLTSNTEGGIDIVQLRFVKDVQEIVGYAMTMSLKVFNAFITGRMPEKKKALGEWYMTIRDKYFEILQKKRIVVD